MFDGDRGWGDGTPVAAVRPHLPCEVPGDLGADHAGGHEVPDMSQARAHATSEPCLGIDRVKGLRDRFLNLGPSGGWF